MGRETNAACGCPVGKAMGVNTWAAFAGGDDNAVVDGDFAVTDAELQPVLKALRSGGINIVAIHHHMTRREPAHPLSSLLGARQSRWIWQRPLKRRSTSPHGTARGRPPDVDPAAFEARGLGVRIGGTPILDGIDFDARRGEIIALIGPNGAGKTTLLEAIVGVRRKVGHVLVQRDGDRELSAERPAFLLYARRCRSSARGDSRPSDAWDNVETSSLDSLREKAGKLARARSIARPLRWDALAR